MKKIKLKHSKDLDAAMRAPWIETLTVHEVKGEKVFFFVLYHPFFCYTVWKYNTGNNGKTSILMAAVIRVAELQSYAEL